jgi:hypothetical protein
VRVSAHVCSELLHIDSSGRCYMIAVAKPELLKAMRGVSLIGFDAKLDFNIYASPHTSSRSPTLATTELSAPSSW